MASAIAEVRETSSKIFLKRTGAGVKQYNPRNRSGKEIDYANAWKDVGSKSTGIKERILASDEFRYMQRVNTVKRDRRTIEEVQQELRGPQRKGKTNDQISFNELNDFICKKSNPWDDQPEPAPKKAPQVSPTPVGPDRVLISEALAQTAAAGGAPGSSKRAAHPAAASNRIPVPRSQVAPKAAAKRKGKSKLQLIKASCKRTHNGFFHRDLKYLGPDPEKSKNGRIVPMPFEGAKNVQAGQGATLHSGNAAASSSNLPHQPMRPQAAGGRTLPVRPPPPGTKARPMAGSVPLTRASSDPSSGRQRLAQATPSRIPGQPPRIPGQPPRMPTQASQAPTTPRIPGQLQRIPGQVASTNTSSQRSTAQARVGAVRSAPSAKGKQTISPLAAARKGMSGRIQMSAYRPAIPPQGQYAEEEYEDESPDEYEYDSFVEEDDEMDDSPVNIRRQMDSIVGRLSRKRRYESDDDTADMEASVHDIEREEHRSRALGRKSDIEEERAERIHAQMKKRKLVSSSSQ